MLPASLAVMARVVGGVKMLTSMRGIDLHGQPHQRRLARAAKWPKGCSGGAIDKVLLPATPELVEGLSR